MRTYSRYSELKKPSWAPPSWLFGPVWTVLYLIIAVSFGAVFVDAIQGDVSWLIALPFMLNLIFNFAYTPLEFRLKSNALASIDIVLTWVTIIWAIVAVYPYSHWITYAQIPYLLWVSFATCLQLTITWMNRERK